MNKSDETFLIETLQFQMVHRYYSRQIIAWEELHPMQRELASTSGRKRAMNVGITPEIKELIENYKMQELKDMTRSNYVLKSEIQGNKSWKKTWAKAVVKSKERGFNTFIVGVKKNKKHLLNGQVDVLLMIQNFM